MQKTLNYSIHSSKKHRQYESNKVNNTWLWYISKTGLTAICPREMHHISNFVRLCFNNNKNTTLKKHKKHKKLKNHKNVFFKLLYKNIKKTFFTSM